MTTDTSSAAVIVRAFFGDAYIEDRHEGANGFTDNVDGVLTVYGTDNIIAAYAPGRWISAIIEKKDA